MPVIAGRYYFFRLQLTYMNGKNSMQRDEDFENSVKALREIAESDYVLLDASFRRDLQQFIAMLERHEFTNETNDFMLNNITRPSLSIKDLKLQSEIQHHLHKIIWSPTYTNPVDKAVEGEMYDKSIDGMIKFLQEQSENITNKKDKNKMKNLIDALISLKTSDESPVFDSKMKKIGMVPTPPDVKIQYAVRLIESYIEFEKHSFTKFSFLIFRNKSEDQFIQAASSGRLDYAKTLAELLHKTLNNYRSIDRSPLLGYTDKMATTKLQPRYSPQIIPQK